MTPTPGIIAVERKAVGETVEPAGLLRELSTWDATLITVGSVLGTAIFITTGDIAREVPHPALIVLLWVAGGLITLAGALTYAELGTMFPRAGGQYHFLREAYGPLCGFLFGWASFLVVMSGGIAALGVGFGEYLGVFVPFFSTKNTLFQVAVGTFTWMVSGGQLAAVLAIAVLSAINYCGLREGVFVQNMLTIVKIASLVALAGLGLLVKPLVTPEWLAPVPMASAAPLGLGMVAVLWAYDGWYSVTFSAGEIRNPARSLPRGLVLGTLIVTCLYSLVNLVYLRALPIQEIGQSNRIGEAAATALFGGFGGRLIAAAVLVSTFGCLSSTILCCSRIYLAMAQDNLFFKSVASIHPRFRTPGAGILAQGAWASVLALSGTYDQLYTYVVFSSLIFHMLTGAAVVVLRRTRPSPQQPRPYGVPGYPWVPALFVLASTALMANTLIGRPREAIAGLFFIGLGLPAYAYWSRSGLSGKTSS